jgi:DNA-nicking Smr family endonuclease
MPQQRRRPQPGDMSTPRGPPPPPAPPAPPAAQKRQGDSMDDLRDLMRAEARRRQQAEQDGIVFRELLSTHRQTQADLNRIAEENARREARILELERERIAAAEAERLREFQRQQEVKRLFEDAYERGQRSAAEQINMMRNAEQAAAPPPPAPPAPPAPPPAPQRPRR